MSISQTTSMRETAEKVLAHKATVLAHQQKQAAAPAPDPEPTVNVPDPAFHAATAPLKVKLRVTTPALSIPEGTAIVCRILNPIRVSDVEDAKFGPARVCDIEAPNGEVRVLILNEVLHAALTKTYSKDSYVNCWFHIFCLPGMREGKRGKYRDYAVTEIEAPTE